MPIMLIEEVELRLAILLSQPMLVRNQRDCAILTKSSSSAATTAPAQSATGIL